LTITPISRRSSYVVLNGLRVFYLAWEPEDNGKSVLLLHGLASNARIWDKVGPLLSANGYRAIAPDQRGHGLTDKPDTGYEFGQLSGDVFAGLDAWHLQRPLLIGHSWGANVVLDYAARFPVGPLAPRGIVLVDGGVARIKDSAENTWEQVSERLKPPQLAGMPVEEFLDKVKLGQPGWLPDDESQQIILANFEIQADETIAPRLTLDRHLQILRVMWEFEVYEILRKVRCPVLAILAQPSQPENNEFYQLKLKGIESAKLANPSLQVFWMPDAIHDIPLQRPEALVELIQKFDLSV
jgi:pimeloyl-ACP methyl ester carboxylesterase